MQHKNVILFSITLFCIGLNGLKAQTISDIDGNVYKTITIGNQVWMKENLKTTKYNDGKAIPLVKDDMVWKELTTPAFCWNNNDETANKNKYGALYNWYTVNTNKLCPRGWHVPANAEWTILTTYLGGESVAGGKLKETGTTHWESPNTGATNEKGFTALPGGSRNYAGAFNYTGSNVIFFRSNGCWWSSTGLSDFNAYYRRLYNSLSEVYSSLSVKQFGYSIRCMKDN
jgi:Fibrobacter succinogenes major domain (Fib_succ_major).